MAKIIPTPPNPPPKADEQKSPPPPPQSDVVDPRDKLISELVSKIEALETKTAHIHPPRPNPLDPPDLPVFNAEPPAEGFKRIRIKTVRGRPVTSKIGMIDDTSLDPSDPLYRRVGPLHARQVVDVPINIFEKMRNNRGRHHIELDLIEETTLPATRPFVYAGEAEMRMCDPRYKRSRAEAEADMERVIGAARGRTFEKGDL